MYIPRNPLPPAVMRPFAAGLVVLSVLGLAACGDKKEKAASQTAAKVNKEEITVHQINYVLQQQRGLKPEQADAASRQVLERLIDQELAVQRSTELKVDRDPRVVQQIEAAKREILARAYAEKVGEAAAKPSAEELQKYYDERPALFKERRIYSLQEIVVEAAPEQRETVRARLAAAKSVNDFLEGLKAEGIRFAGNQAVRAAEQLPLSMLEQFGKLKDGQAMVVPNAAGLQVIYLAGTRSQPVAFDQAKGAIEQFLMNDRKRKLVDDDIKAMRSAAAISYVGKFAEKAAGAAGAASDSAPAVPAAQPTSAAPAASGLDAGSISKGLGLK